MIASRHTKQREKSGKERRQGEEAASSYRLNVAEHAPSSRV